MVDTTALVGTARVGSALVGSLGATPPSRLRVHGACWELVADQAAIDAAKDHVAERERVVRDDLALLAQEKADAAKDAAVQAAGEAAQRADEALEAALGEMVEGKSNVFIQGVPPVASMRRQGVLWIDTTPVTLADGTTVPGHTPKTWDPATSAWVAVTDSVAVEAARVAAAAHEAAEAAADSAGAAMAEARYAPRIADRAPGPADGEGKPAGAGWWQYDPVSQLLVQGWRWSGAAWERLDMDPVMIPVISIGTGTVGDLTGDRVTVTGEFVARVAQILQLDVAQLVVTEGAVINELVARAMAAATASFQEAYIQNLRTNGAQIDAAVIGDLAANIITSGLFRTATEGQRLEIDSNGLVMYGLDDDGNEYELVRLGPSGENLLTIGQTTVAADGIATPSVDTGALTVSGRDVTTFPDEGARGVVAWAYSTSASAWDGSGSEVPRLRVSALLRPGRLYSVTMDQKLIRTRTGATGPRFIERLRFNATDVGRSGQLAIGVSSLPASVTTYSTPGFVGWLDMDDLGTTEDTPVQVWWSTQGAAGRDYRIEGGAGQAVRLTLRDEGPAVGSSGMSWFNTGTPAEGAADAPPPAAEKVTRTEKFAATRAESWNRGSSSFLSGKSGTVYQGKYPGVAAREGAWWFNALTGNLSGATIKRVQLRFYVTHTYWGAGGTVDVRLHGKTSFSTGGLDTSIRTMKVKRNAQYSVDVPSQYLDGFRTGLWRGFGLSTASTDLEYYVQARLANAEIWITYEK